MSAEAGFVALRLVSTRADSNSARERRVSPDGGTTVAQPSRQMKKNAIFAEIAALARKKLPVRLPCGEETRARRVERRRTTRSLGPRATIRWSAAVDSPFPDHPSEAPSAAGPTDRRVLPVVERVFHLLWNELGVMRQMRPDTRAVVLKADCQTEILLHLTRGKGQIEARARCERGDFQSLNEAWAELQRAVDHLGVRLMPLDKATQHPEVLSSPGPPCRSGCRAHQGCGLVTGFFDTAGSAKSARRKAGKVRPAPGSIQESRA